MPSSIHSRIGLVPRVLADLVGMERGDAADGGVSRGEAGRPSRSVAGETAAGGGDLVAALDRSEVVSAPPGEAADPGGRRDDDESRRRAFQ